MRYLILIPLLTGCGTFQATPTGVSGAGSAVTDREGAYYYAQSAAAIAAAQAAAAPIFELEAVPGQTLQISGLGRIAVRSPNAGAPTAIRQYENEWAKITGQVLGSVLPLAVGQYGAYKIVTSLGETTQAVAGTVAALGGDGFNTIGHSGTQTAEVAIHGQQQIAAGTTQLGTTAAAGFGEIGVTAQAGIDGTVQTGQAGFNALTSTSQFALGELGDTSRFSISTMGDIGETGILEAGRDPLVVNQPDPIVVNQPDPVVVEQPPPVIVNQPDPIVVNQPVFGPAPP